MSQSLAVVGNPKGYNELQSLGKAMKAMPNHLVDFTNHMVSLYGDNAVGVNNAAGVKFCHVRDETFKDAIKYLHHVLPFSEKLVLSIQKFFETYIYLTYEDWKEALPDIIEDVSRTASLCDEVLKMHEKIITSLRKRGRQVGSIISDLTSLQRQYEAAAEDHQSQSKSKDKWASIFFFIPVLNFLIYPILKDSARVHKTIADANKTKAQFQAEAVQIVQASLIPALEGFFKAMVCAAQFFSVMKCQLTTFAMDGRENLENPPAEYHFKMMKGKAQEIKSYSIMFMMTLPSVRTSFLALLD